MFIVFTNTPNYLPGTLLTNSSITLSDTNSVIHIRRKLHQATDHINKWSYSLGLIYLHNGWLHNEPYICIQPYVPRDGKNNIFS